MAKDYSLAYPRRRLARFLIRLLGRILLPILFKLEISGRKKFPRNGPLLVVGNHTAAMEAVLLNIYSPWPIEMLSAADTPAERITETVANLYGVIPIHRGSYDRVALNAALDVLKQGGFIGLFPEGGIWQEGKKKALPGIAWLSYRSGAPVLPIGFGDTTGVINTALKFKRPTVSMKVGDLLEPAQIPPGKARKEYFQEYADQVMEAVHDLVPVDEFLTEPEIINEEFELSLKVHDRDGKSVEIPEELVINDKIALAKFLHRPAILKIFKVNLSMPVEPLQSLHTYPSTSELILAVEEIVNYLKDENPYLFTYRFGVKEGLSMQQSLEDLLGILNWCTNYGHQISIIPTRRYYSIKEDREITQIEQGQFQSWM
jgi:1-acyl-sn-glycerol-3-phosphate acyltransferase